jgi:hypothetical protein
MRKKMSENHKTPKQQQTEDYARTAGSAGNQTEDGPPVLDTVSPMMLLVVVLIIVAALGLLGWGVIIVFGI